MTPLIFFLVCGDHPIEHGLFLYQDKQTDLFGFHDAKGSVVIPAQFEQVFLPPQDEALFVSTSGEFEFLVPVYKNGAVWRMTKDGTLQFETVYFDNGPDYYCEGLSRFLKYGKVGFHDIKGHIAVQPLYDFATPFSNGYSFVCNGCYAYYPEMPTYRPLQSSLFPRHQQDMYDNLAEGKWGAIDKEGKVIVPLTHNSLEAVQKLVESKSDSAQ